MTFYCPKCAAETECDPDYRCKPCKNERSKEWRLRHPGYHQIKSSEWRIRNWDYAQRYYQRKKK